MCNLQENPRSYNSVLMDSSYVVEFIIMTLYHVIGTRYPGGMDKPGPYNKILTTS
jgi:hypothetical protein